MNRDYARFESPVVWYDTRHGHDLVSRIGNLGYSGVVVYPENLDAVTPKASDRLCRVYHCESPDNLESLASHPSFRENAVVASPDLAVLERAQGRDLATCFRAHVVDEPSLKSSIEKGRQHDYLMVSFRDPTNIPLELIIASLQRSDTILIKEILDPKNVEDALVTLGVMEVGADGVMFSPGENAKLDEFVTKLSFATQATKLEAATIVRAQPVGMGYRSCIDLATLFTPTEGMIVGSTSQGGILLCPEVFFLPYMELRPFRVNAGAVHSYVYNAANHTDYMTELRAGSQVMVVDSSGRSRRACVGRMKTEVRPLRLIEAEFAGGERVNVLLQDDWHVRIFSEDAKPLNVTELKPGTRVLGHVAKPGRHVGIGVDEHIVEQ